MQCLARTSRSLSTKERRGFYVAPYSPVPPPIQRLPSQGYTGLVTGLKHGVFTYSNDARCQGGKLLDNIVAMLLTGAQTPGQHARRVFEQAATFEQVSDIPTCICAMLRVSIPGSAVPSCARALDCLLPSFEVRTLRAYVARRPFLCSREATSWTKCTTSSAACDRVRAR